MTPRQARVALSVFAMTAAGVVYNAIYMQDEAAPGRRAGGEAAPAVSARAEKPRPDRSRSGQGLKRAALLKLDAAKVSATPGAPPGEPSTETVRAIQRELDQRGFGPLASDGIMRPATRAAIMSYEHDHRLPLTGEATEALLARLVLGAPAADAPSGAGHVQSPHAEATIKQVQRLLAANGYRPGPADGRLGAETTAAIRAFEQDQGLAPKGRVSAEVVARLQAGTARLKSAEAR